MKLKKLDLFSGIGGISIALEDYFETVGYVEIDRYAQAVLISRMLDGTIKTAPIFRDVTRLDGRKLRGRVDVIAGGFPCQDISVAGNGGGLMASEADFSMKSSGLSKKLSQWSLCLKMFLRSGQEDLMLSSKNLPRSGMIVGGQLFQPQALEPHTKEKDGFLWPTPVASRCGYQSQGNGTKKYMLPQLWKMGKLPTPTARDWKDVGQVNMSRKSPSLPNYWKATHGTTMPSSFVEWIMDYRIGHTDLNALVTPLFHFKSKQRSKN